MKCEIHNIWGIYFAHIGLLSYQMILSLKIKYNFCETESNRLSIFVKSDLIREEQKNLWCCISNSLLLWDWLTFAPFPLSLGSTLKRKIPSLSKLILIKFQCEDNVIVFLKAVRIMVGSDYHIDDADDLLWYWWWWLEHL